MVITKIEIDGVQYRIFEDVVLFPRTKNEVSVNVAEQALDNCIMQKIDNEKYHEVRGVDETYGYVVDQEIADSENEDDIRESIEDIYDADEFVGVSDINLD